MIKFIGINVLVLVMILVRKIAGDRISGKLRYRLWLLVPIAMVLSLFVTFNSPVDMTPYVPEKVVSVAKGEPIEKEEPVIVIETVTNHIPQNVNGSVVRSVNEKTIPSMGTSAGEANNYKTDKVIGIDNREVNSSAVPVTEGKAQAAPIQPAAKKLPETTVEESSEAGFEMPEINIETVLRTVWIIGAIVTFAIFMIVNIAFALKLRNNRIFFKTLKETGAKVYFYKGMNSPFLFMNEIYIHPKIAADASLMEYSLIHESCHRKQGDSWWPLLKFVVLSIFWFDPLFWYAAKLISDDCEISCDERVVDVVGDVKRNDYAKSLLTVFEMGNPTIRFAAAASLSANGKNTIKERIMTLKRSAKKSIAIALMVIMVLSGTVACSLTDPFSSDETTDTQPTRDRSSERRTEDEEETEESVSEDTDENAGTVAITADYVPADLSSRSKLVGEPTAAGSNRIAVPYAEDYYCRYAFNDKGIAYLVYCSDLQPTYFDPNTTFKLVLCDIDGNIIKEKELESHDYGQIVYYRGKIAVVYRDDQDNIGDHYGDNIMIFNEDLDLLAEHELDSDIRDIEIGTDGAIYTISLVGLMMKITEKDVTVVGDFEDEITPYQIVSCQVFRVGDDIYGCDGTELYDMNLKHRYKLDDQVPRDAFPEYYSSPDNEILRMGYKLSTVEFNRENTKLVTVTEGEDIMSVFAKDDIIYYPGSITKTDSGRIFYAEQYPYEIIFDENELVDMEYPAISDGTYHVKFWTNNVNNAKMTFDRLDVIILDKNVVNDNCIGSTIDLTQYGFGLHTFEGYRKVVNSGVPTDYVKQQFGEYYNEQDGLVIYDDGPTDMGGMKMTGRHVVVDEYISLYELEDGRWLVIEALADETPLVIPDSRYTMPIAEDVKITDKLHDWLQKVNACAFPITNVTETTWDSPEQMRDSYYNSTMFDYQFKWATIKVENGKITEINLSYLKM